MIISQKGLDALASLEGFKGLAYQDVAGVWTIGFGETEGVKPGDMIGYDDAWEKLEKRCDDIASFLSQEIHVPLEQHQFDALVSFVYNIGKNAFRGSQVHQMINLKCYDQIPALMSRWRYVTVRGEKVVSEGLMNRRRKEEALWRNEPELKEGKSSVKIVPI